jgi:hypothetical protein
MSLSYRGAVLLFVVALLTSIVITPALAAPQAASLLAPPIAPALVQAETPVAPSAISADSPPVEALRRPQPPRPSCAHFRCPLCPTLAKPQPVRAL